MNSQPFTHIGVLEKEKLVFGDTAPADAFLTGSIKEPPTLQLAASTFGGEITFTVNLRGTARDKEKINGFFKAFLKELP